MLRHGCPAVGQTRARLPRHSAPDRRAAARATPYGRQRSAGTTGANSDTTGVPTAAARCAGPVFGATTHDRAVEDGGERRQVTPSAEVEDAVRRLTSGDVPGQGRLRRRSGHHHPVPGRDKSGDQHPRMPRRSAAGRWSPHRDGTPRTARHRSGAGRGRSPTREAAGGPPARRPRSSAEKPGRRRQAQIAFGLGHIVGTGAADPAGPGIVLADRRRSNPPRPCRSSRASGSGDWWKEVKIKARSKSLGADPPHQLGSTGGRRAAGRAPPTAPRTRAPQSTPGSSRAAVACPRRRPAW